MINMSNIYKGSLYKLGFTLIRARVPEFQWFLRNGHTSIKRKRSKQTGGYGVFDEGESSEPSRLRLPSLAMGPR